MKRKHLTTQDYFRYNNNRNKFKNMTLDKAVLQVEKYERLLRDLQEWIEKTENDIVEE